MKFIKILSLIAIISSCTIIESPKDKSLQMKAMRNIMGNISQNPLLDKEDVLKMGTNMTKLLNWDYKDNGIHKYKEINLENIKIYSLENEKSDKAILLLHGGAFYMPLIKQYKDLMYYIVTNSKYNPSVYMPDYRVYPEMYPKAHMDALDSYNYLLKIGYTPENIIVMGDSAGGHLTVSLMHMLKDKGIPRPKAIVLYSPWLDISNTVSTRKTNIHNDILIGNPRSDIVLTDAVKNPYYFLNADKNDKYVNPLLGDFKNFPYTYFQVDKTEILLGDSLELNRLIKKSNKDKRVFGDLYNGNYHVFQVLFDYLPEAKTAVNETIKMIDYFYNLKETNDK